MAAHEMYGIRKDDDTPNTTVRLILQVSRLRSKWIFTIKETQYNGPRATAYGLWPMTTAKEKEQEKATHMQDVA